ncbi:tensin-1 isoform X3 [Hyalella azteca]|uniref:Tensin-1 isoform X3 n=1 Tax=Hyalella azteca TaxID=294128 RepID=A0A979FTL8_HYAAZ|nr:tensin-1 isoform X3 [Hyalella azteca]
MMFRSLRRRVHKKSHLEATDSTKQPLSSSRNTQSAARLNRIISVSFGPSYKNGSGSSSTLPHTRTLPCAMPTVSGGSSLRVGHSIAHGRGGSLREDLTRQGYNTAQRMDLVYVTERIISLAFPPDLDGSAYTMHLREVAHMLSSKHGDNFRVFNLSWHQGEVSHYLPRVTELGWPPLLAPALEKLCAVCKALESWLAANNQHVAVLHDREGYEKLGVVVAAYMHYTNICASTDTALDRYAMKRFFDDKIGQLYHPSQKRYVQYFSGLLSGLIRINSNPLFLHTLTLYGVPHFESRGGCHLFIKVYQGMTHVYTSGVYQITEGLRYVTIVLEQHKSSNTSQNNARVSGIQLRGDVLLKAYHRRLGPPPSREVVFRAQFHTCAVSEKVLGFSRLDLDDACNDLRFPLDGGIELSFSRGGDDPPRAVSNVSCDKSPCPVTAWDSYEVLPGRRDETGAHESVPHTLGPLDGSLYATVNKRRNNSDINNVNNIKNSSSCQQFDQQQQLQQHPESSLQYPVDHRLDHHLHHPHSSYSLLRQTPVRSQQDHFSSVNIGQHSRSTPHTPQHPSLLQQQQLQQHSTHHTPVATGQHLVHHQHHLSQHHHHHHIHHQGSQPHHQQQQQHQQLQQQYQSSHTPSHALQHASLATPSPLSSAYANGRYPASVDSGFAGSIAPLSPPTSSVSPAASSQPQQSSSSTSTAPPQDNAHLSYRQSTSSTAVQEHSRLQACQASADCQNHDHRQQPPQVYRRFSDPNQLNMAPVAAVASRPTQASRGGPSSRVDARQLDELLAGMLLDIESIPDLRPGQSPAPDINSIRCPDLSWNTSSTRGRSSSSRSGPTMSPVNGYGGVSHHDSMLDTSLTLSAADEGTPYHTRLDSRPFSYGAVTSSPVLPRRRSPSPNSSPNRRVAREPIISRSGLESPRLVRRMSGSVGAVAGNTTTDSGAAMSAGSHINSSVLGNGTTTNTTRRSPSPSPEPGSRNSTLRRERSQTLTNRIMAGEPSPPSSLTRSHVTRSASRLDDPDAIFAPDTLSRSLSGTSSSWLATQQRKLVERREANRRADRGRHEARVINELRSRIGQHYNRTNTTNTSSSFSGVSRYGRYGDFEDGYVSDTTLFSDTSRESSPTKHHPYSPLSVSTGYNNTLNSRDTAYRRSASAREHSEPSSPNVASKTATHNFARDRLQRLNQHYANTTKTLSLSRKYSDASHDRERPFVSIKRAFASDRGRDSALTQLQSNPLGHINYHHSSSPHQGEGLLTTLHHQTKHSPASASTSSAKVSHAFSTATDNPRNVTPVTATSSVHEDDVTRARNAYKTYLASIAANKVIPNNYDDARAFVAADKNVFRERSLDMSNLRKAPSSNYIDDAAANDASRYYNMIIPNVISDALACTQGTSNNAPSSNKKTLPNDLYFASDNRVYNITGYTNSLDRGVHKRLSSLNHFRIDSSLKHNNINNVIPEPYSSTLPKTLNQSSGQSYNLRSYCNGPKPSQSSANTSSSSGAPESSENKDSESSTSVSVSCSSANDFMLVSAPEGFNNCTSSVVSAVSPVSPKPGDEGAWQSDCEGGVGGAHRPITPGFPPSTPTTPYLNQGLPPKSPTMQRRAHLGLSSLNNQRPASAASTASNNSKDQVGMGMTSSSQYRSTSPHNGHASPAPSLYQGPSRRSSLTSLNDSGGHDVIHSHPKFVKDISKFWYKPNISRDEAINILKSKPPGTFIVRDSNSFPGAFGLAVKVATPPPNVVVSSTSGDPANELVRHFLIEPTARGVRLKGCSNEPVFGSLSALVYQHSITALALPCRLALPERDPAASTASTSASSTSVDNSVLLQQGAACTVLYLHSLDTESLTGPQAVKRAVTSLLSAASVRPTPVHFKVSSAGITLTDNHRTLFFRQHFPVAAISHCGTDPDDRRWQHNSDTGEPLASLRIFGFVAKKGTARNQNQCHVLAELEPEQPATAICNFVTKVMMTSANRANLV